MIQDVEDLPTELQQMSFGVRHLPGLGQCCIETSVARSADLAASSGFAGKIVAECANSRWTVGIDEHVRHLTGECAALLCPAGLHRADLCGRAFQLPVGWPGASVADRKRESASPA